MQVVCLPYRSGIRQPASQNLTPSEKSLKSVKRRLDIWAVQPIYVVQNQHGNAEYFNYGRKNRQENNVEVTQILNALEREQELLREFYVLSTQQLALLDHENLDDMGKFDIGKLLDTRSDLMLELTAIETTLETWISQLRNESKITSDVFKELCMVNDEIVRLANEILELDEQMQWRLDLIKQKASEQLHGLNRCRR
jgi:hypothetical protein